MFDEIKFLIKLEEQDAIARYKLIDNDEETLVQTLIEKGLVQEGNSMGTYYCLTKAGEILVAVIKKALA